jgi:hypothetical protein
MRKNSQALMLKGYGPEILEGQGFIVIDQKI